MSFYYDDSNEHKLMPLSLLFSILTQIEYWCENGEATAFWQSEIEFVMEYPVRNKWYKDSSVYCEVDGVYMYCGNVLADKHL